MSAEFTVVKKDMEERHTLVQKMVCKVFLVTAFALRNQLKHCMIFLG